MTFVFIRVHSNGNVTNAVFLDFVGYCVTNNKVVLMLLVIEVLQMITENKD